MFVVCPKCASRYKIPPEITLKEGQKLQCSSCRHIFHFQPKEDENLNESSVFGIQIPEDPVLSQTVIHEEEVVYNHELPDVFRPLEPMPRQPSQKWLWLVICLGVFAFVLCGVWFYRDILKTDYISFPVPRKELPQVIERDMEKKFINEPFILPEKKDEQADIKDIPLFFGNDDKFEEKIEKTTVSQCESFDFHSIRFRYEGTDLLIEGVIHNNTDLIQLMPASIFVTAYDHQGQVLFTKEIFLPNEFLSPYEQKAFFGTYTLAPNGVQWMEVSCKN